MAHAPAGGPFSGTQVRARERRHTSGPDDGAIRLKPWRRQRALYDEPADSPCRRRLPPWAAFGLRPRPQFSSTEPVRVDAPAAGDRAAKLRLLNRYNARARNGLKPWHS